MAQAGSNDVDTIGYPVGICVRMCTLVSVGLSLIYSFILLADIGAECQVADGLQIAGACGCSGWQVAGMLTIKQY